MLPFFLQIAFAGLSRLRGRHGPLGSVVLAMLAVLL